MSNWFSSLANAVAKAGTGSATTVETTISGWFSSKYSAITNTFEELEGLGPEANPDQLNGLLAQLGTEFVAAGSVPGAEYSYVTTLKGLVGKNDAASVNLWAQTCANALTTLTNAASTL
jgi:hypothetical protein